LELLSLALKMRRSTDTRVRISSGDSPRFAQRCSPRRRASQDTSPDDRGAALLKPWHGRRRRRKLSKRHKTSNVSKSTSYRDSPAVVPFLKASSSSVIDRFIQAGSASTKRQVSGKIKLCTRVLLPLTLFAALIGVVSFLWIPPRHARRPYSSLADVDNSSVMGSYSHEGKSYDLVNDYSDDQSRRLRASDGSSNSEFRANFRSRLTGRCYDTGGPVLCSRPNACKIRPLLCKCTCASS